MDKKTTNSAKPKSAAHRKAISEGLKKYWARAKKRNPNAGKLTEHGKKMAAERKAVKAGKAPTKQFDGTGLRLRKELRRSTAMSSNPKLSPEDRKYWKAAKKRHTQLLADHEAGKKIPPVTKW